MGKAALDIVTGATGFTGKYITQRLITAGRTVRSLSGHPDRPNPFGEKVRVAPFDFDSPSQLTETMRGARTLYNTYWIRFAYGETTFERALANSRTLIRCAAEAGVRRIVHVSITNPSEDSPFPYFRGKAQVEKAVKESGLSYAILRPAVIFGPGGILINNIAWNLRRFPFFMVFGAGDYRLSPIHVADLAALATDEGSGEQNVVRDAVGPDTFTFDEMVRVIAERIGCKARLMHVKPALGLIAARAIGLLLGDVMLTKDEVGGLTADLLASGGPPTGEIRLGDWVEGNADDLGRRYMSELDRHYR